MPISDQGDYPEGHFQKIYEQIFKPAIENAGYIPYRVDENVISDRIIDKIFNAIQECPMALCDLSNRNPNVLYELGLRQAYDKPVVLVQDEKTDKIFDVSGISTVFYKSDRLFENVLDARERISNAINETKEGKRNSIVRIVKSKSADYDAVTISDDDKINIILSEIKQSIADIKETVQENSKEDNKNYRRKPELTTNTKNSQTINDFLDPDELDKALKAFEKAMQLRKGYKSNN